MSNETNYGRGTKFRVSAKQRLELVKQAWENFKDAVEPDIDKLQQDIEDALTGKLEPKNKPVE